MAIDFNEWVQASTCQYCGENHTGTKERDYLGVATVRLCAACNTELTMWVMLLPEYELWRSVKAQIEYYTQAHNGGEGVVWWLDYARLRDKQALAICTKLLAKLEDNATRMAAQRKGHDDQTTM